MAIIVDKIQKRRDIAMSCNDLLLEKGIKKLTISEVAATAGVSKGSIYDYFLNKEDIVFEIIRSHIADYQTELNKKLTPELSTKQKVYFLFDFLLNDNEAFKKHQNIYKEYISIGLSSENENMSKFNSECNSFFKSILTSLIEDGIAKNELKSESLSFINGLLAVEKGFLLIQWSEKKDIKKELKEFLETFFTLIELKNTKV